MATKWQRRRRLALQLFRDVQSDRSLTPGERNLLLGALDVVAMRRRDLRRLGGFGARGRWRSASGDGGGCGRRSSGGSEEEWVQLG